MAKPDPTTVDPNSALIWWNKTNALKIPQPKTVMVPMGRGIEKELERRSHEIGYPLFMRTDLASGKHEWPTTCFVRNSTQIREQFRNLLMWCEMADMMGLPTEAIMLREYVSLESTFAAFGGMPVARERRYFVNGAEVKCHHPYWIEDAVEKGARPQYPLPENWRGLLSELNTETPEEVYLLTEYASKIGAALGEDWSVDFARGVDGQWYFIDAARAWRSWHPDHVEL